MNEETVARIGRNEVLFRLANEERGQLAEEAGLEDFLIVCECGHGWCKETIVVSREEYPRVRAHPEQFFVLPGHQIDDVEVVVAGGAQTGKHYLVVAKREGLPAEIAKGFDPDV
jgi:hypothetical protein